MCDFYLAILKFQFNIIYLLFIFNELHAFFF